MVRPLETVLEREYYLCKHVPGFSLGEIRVTQSRILDWHYSRLIKDQQEQQKGLVNG